MSNASPSSVELLARRWRTCEADIEIRGATGSEIDALQRRYAVSFPGSFREYLRDAAPASEYCDTELTNWWPALRIKSAADEYAGPLGVRIARFRHQLIVFADYSVWCWAWAVNCSPGPDYGKVAVIGGAAHDRFVANSFEEFLTSYTADPASVAL